MDKNCHEIHITKAHNKVEFIPCQPCTPSCISCLVHICVQHSSDIFVFIPDVHDESEFFSILFSFSVGVGVCSTRFDVDLDLKLFFQNNYELVYSRFLVVEFVFHVLVVAFLDPLVVLVLVEKTISLLSVVGEHIVTKKLPRCHPDLQKTLPSAWPLGFNVMCK